MSTRVTDERLIELILDRGHAAGRELAALRADAALAARIAALEELFGAAAEAVRASERSPRRDEELAVRILARTTREDLTWRGDLRLVATHVKERLRESRFTRYVAALLLCNVTIGPVMAMAWVLMHDAEPQRELHFHVEPVGDLLPAPEDEVLLPLEDDGAPLEGLAGGASGWELPERDNRIRRARYLLAPAHGAVPAAVAPALDATASTALRLLDARARLLAGAAWPSWLDDASWESEGELVALALYAEVLLDRFALEGERAPRFHAALEHLRKSVAAAAEGPARRLGAHALERGASYGVVPHVSQSMPEDPLDAAWRTDLAEALGADAGEAHAAGWTGPAH